MEVLAADVELMPRNKSTISQSELDRVNVRDEKSGTIDCNGT